MKKFTFKKVKREGRYRSFQTKQTTVKLGGLEVGYIIDTDKGWCCHLAVKKERTESNPADFKWIALKAHYPEESEMREFLKKYHVEIQKSYDLYRFID